MHARLGAVSPRRRGETASVICVLAPAPRRARSALQLVKFVKLIKLEKRRGEHTCGLACMYRFVVKLQAKVEDKLVVKLEVILLVLCARRRVRNACNKVVYSLCGKLSVS
jgi:hypothetical protein